MDSRADTSRTAPVPPTPDRFPSLWDIVGNTDSLFFKLFPKYAFEEEVLKRQVLTERFIVLNSPDAISKVLVERPDHYVRSSFQDRQLSPVLGRGLIVSSGEAWQRQRRATQPAFRPAPLVRHASVTLAEVRRWLASLQGRPDGAPLCDELQALALRTSARSLFSVDLGARDESLLAILTEFTELISAGGFLDVILPGWLPTRLNRRRSELRDAWFSWIDRLAAERLAMPPSVGPDLVSVCLAAGEASGFRDADLRELRDQMSTFLIGATETTGYALRWAVYMLAAFPAIQEAVAQEVEGANLDATFADMRAGADAFRHLRAFLRETLRLYPPIKVLGRDATGPDLLGGVEVRKGDRIIVAPFVLHRHRRLWGQPDAFRPERFLPDAPAPTRFAYLPFGIGPRVCIGAGMANLTLTITLAALLQTFRVHRADQHPIAPRAVGAGMVPNPTPTFRLEPRRPRTGQVG